MSEKIYCVEIMHSAIEVEYYIAELNIIEETPTRLVIQSRSGHEFMLLKTKLNSPVDYYFTTREKALAGIKDKLERLLEDKKKLVQSYQEALYDLEREK